MITVHPEKKADLEARFAFLEDGGAHEFRVCAFEKPENYSLKSDSSDSVKESITRNTKSCIEMGQGMTLVLQEDVVFADRERVLSGLRTAVTFMEDHPEADMFMLGVHPNSRYRKYKDGIVKYRHAVHWQAVIFRKKMLKNLSEDIPQGVHSDEYIASNMTSRVQAYGLRSPVAFQDVTTRWRRRWEYGLLYGFRSRYPYGDPLWQFVSFLRATTVVMILYFLIR